MINEAWLFMRFSASHALNVIDKGMIAEAAGSRG